MMHRSILARTLRAFAVFAALAGTANSSLGQNNNTYLPPPGHGADNAPRDLTPPNRTYGSGHGNDANPGYGEPYSPPPASGPNNGPYGHGQDGPPANGGADYEQNTYSPNEIIDAGHHFFGNVSEGLAKVVEYAFQRNGRPTGYILGQEGGGAVVAGLRYGEGVLYTKQFPPRKIYWQGPSLGYDFGADGSKTMTLVYNMVDTVQLYDRFGGVEGSAYLVGGVGITFLTSDTLTLAPIRAGVGLRLGANVGYLKYTPTPTWNPF